MAEIRADYFDYLRHFIATLEKRLAKSLEPDERRRLSAKRHQQQRRLATLKDRLARLKADHANGTVRLCFGGRKRLNGVYSSPDCIDNEPEPMRWGARKHPREPERRSAMEHTHGALIEQLEGLETTAVAFSGGADSTLLLALARKQLGAERVIALTAVTPYMVRQEIGDAVALTTKLAVRHELVEIPMPEGMEHNPADRCYRCKRAMYGQLLESAAEYGFASLLDGSNTDDADEQCPGLRALRELGIRSPFIEAGIDKAAVRQMARELDLPTWHKPTTACLLTRIGFNVRVSMDQLQRIEEAERFLTQLGYTWVRVRCHGDLARIEVAPVQRERLLSDAGAVIEGIQRFGFRYVSMDLAGYQSGSMAG